MGSSLTSHLVHLWSEPPIAVLGLGTGTTASYARPGQVIHFTERNPRIVKLSLPDADREPHFHYLQDALERGARLQVFTGPMRQTFARKGGERFYHLIEVECYRESVAELEKDLMTREGMQILMSKLAEEGVLCYHVSNRYYDLPPILGSVAADLKLACVVGRDTPPGQDRPRSYSSEWVLIARKPEYLRHLQTPAGYEEPGGQKYWSSPDNIQAKYVWTDLGEKSYRGVYRSDPQIMELDRLVFDVENFLTAKLPLGYMTVYNAARPLHEAIRAWSQASAEARNREPPESPKTKK
jgi:hypothetical protein